jgi:hypothetical protein
MLRSLLATCFAAVLFAGVAGGFTGSARLDDDAAAKGDAFDIRTATGVIGPTKAQTKAIVSLVREHNDVKIRWNAIFGTPATVLRHGATLTEARAGTPTDAAREWVNAHRGLFGWSAAQVAALSVEKSLAQPGNGPRTVLFHQLFDGLHGNNLGGSLVIGLDASNRILSVRANVVRVPALDGSWRLSAARALEVASGKPASKALPRQGEWLRFARGVFAANHYVRKVAFPVGESPARPAWDVFFVKRLNEGYRTLVDAATGEVLYRYQLARNEAPEGLVFDTYPGAPKGGEQVMRSFAGDPEASPNGWLSVLGSPDLPTTLGNNASTATNWAVFLVPDGPGQVRPLAPTGVFDFAFTDAWNSSECGANPISTMEGLPTTGGPDTPTYALDANAAVTNLFYHHNVMHDFFYKLGFDEDAGAMQASNFGKTGPDLENDPLLGLAQAGAASGDAPLYLGRDNAYMFPWPDGIPSWSGMFLWETVPGAINVPCVDGDFATDVIYHEYAHGVTSRWVGAEFGNLETQHGGSMGEAWSDFFALHYLHEKGFETRDEIGWYVTPSPNGGIRNWGLADVPVTLADIGYDMSNEEVHSDGEIWNGVLWDLRLTMKRAKANGAAYLNQLVADAMPISGPVPSMVDMRDAILAADVARSKGANQSLLWSVFARHGMGKSAMAKDGFDVNPIPAFDHPEAARNGTVTGRVVDAMTGKPIAGAKLIISEFEARISPVKRSASDGTFRFAMQEGRYPLTIVAHGYGSRRIDLSLQAGETIARDFALAVNHASAAAGASASSENPSTLGAPRLAIDETATTAWWSDAAADGTAAGESIVIDLAGKTPVEVSEIRLSAYPAKAAGAGASLKRYAALVSLDGKTFTKVAEGRFALDPVFVKSPDINYRNVRLPKPAKAAFVKIVAEETMDDASAEVSISEIQVFGTGDAVKVTVPPDPAATVLHDEGTILVPSPAVSLTAEVMGLGACIFPPPTQGIDAWVTEVPDEFGDGNHIVDSYLEALLPDPRPDLDLFMLTADCASAGSVASSAPRETGTIPQGTKYIVASLFTTLPGNVVTEASSVLFGQVPSIPAPRVLPNTGVGNAAPIAIGILAVATAIGMAALTRRARRT